MEIETGGLLPLKLIMPEGYNSLSDRSTSFANPITLYSSILFHGAVAFTLLSVDIYTAF